MGYIIAVSGKGGVGKTTLSALIVRQLLKRSKKPVLAIDADPNSCLDAALGVTVENTVGSVREEAREEAQKGLEGIAKTDLLNLRIAESLVESKGFDFIAMGRPEGPGCYCFANSVLKSVITQIADNYGFVVLDNEAGLENLSRRIVQKVDVLIMVSDPSKSGLKTLKRLHGLADEMDIKYGKLLIAVNRLQGKMPSIIDEITEDTKADMVFGIPDDKEIASYSEEGKALIGVSDDNPVVKLVDDIVTNLITN